MNDFTSVPTTAVTEMKERPTAVADDEAFWRSRREPQNLHLAVVRGSRLYYLSVDDYNRLSQMKRKGLDKKGVVVIGDGVQFIVDLRDVGRRGGFDWEAAMNYHGDLLPDYKQAEEWARQNDAINNAINNFGGDYLYAEGGNMNWFWTKTPVENEDGPSKMFAFMVNANTGEVNFTYMTNYASVRAVYPIVSEIE